jgi:hypothetical protein
MAEPDFPSGAQELFPVEVTDGILPVAAPLQASIPFPPQAILTDHLNLPMGFSTSLMLRAFYKECGWYQRFVLTSFGITTRHLLIFFGYGETQTRRGNAANVSC